MFCDKIITPHKLQPLIQAYDILLKLAVRIHYAHAEWI